MNGNNMTVMQYFSEAQENLQVGQPAENKMNEACVLPFPSATSSFFDMLDYEFRRAIRYKNALTLVFIKLCKMDEVVRNYGQKNADRIISEIERLILSNIRNTDRGFAYGRDEIMIILPNTSQNCANHLIPKLRRLIEDYNSSKARGMSVNLTPKFGVASYPQHEISLEN